MITSTALGNERAPASDRIVMGGIGIGNMGTGDQGAFLGRGDVQYVAVCDVRKSVRDTAKGSVDEHYKTGLPGLQRLPRAAGPRRYRRGARRHARPLARDHGDRGLPQRQRRLLPEARDANAREGPLMVDGRAPLLRRVVSGGSQRVLEDYRGIVDQCWGGELGPIKSINVNVGPLSQTVQPAGGTTPSRHRLGHVARPGAVGAVQRRALRRQLRHQRRTAGGRTSTTPAAA